MAKRVRGLDAIDRGEFERLEAARAKAPMAAGAADLAFELSHNLRPDSVWTDIWSRLQDRADRGVELSEAEAKDVVAKLKRAIEEGK